jgi:DNA repair exonuclease SbcCD ATPase subunit
MMILISLDLENFMNIKEAHFSFQQGINVLYGDNGQGKSSVFEAIADQKRGDSWKDYVKLGEKAFSIKMVIQLSDDASDTMSFDYRGVKSKGSVEKKIVYKNETYTGEDTANLLNKTFDQDMLRNTAFLLQDTIPITKMKPSERRDIFKKIFNSDFPEAIKAITEDQKKVDTQIVEIKAKVDLFQKKEYRLFRIIEVEEAELESLRKELQDSQASELEKEKYKNYSEKVKELNNKQTELSRLVQNKNSYLKQMETLVQEVKKAVDECGEETSKLLVFNHDIANKKMVLDSVEFQKKKYEESFNIKDITTDKDRWTRAKVNSLSEISLYKKYIDAHKKGKCETCGQDCNSNDIPKFQAIIELNEKGVQDADKELKAIEDKVKTYQLTCTVDE